MTIFDDLALLRAFVDIVEGGSISAAARRLKIPQPTLSRYLRTMEERCGAALLRRDTHRMSLTETGHRVLADARAILDLAGEAVHRLRVDQTTLTGHLRDDRFRTVHRYTAPSQVSPDKRQRDCRARVHKPSAALGPGRL
jgi:DNA-binding IclR family transcriptional regulator